MSCELLNQEKNGILFTHNSKATKLLDIKPCTWLLFSEEWLGVMQKEMAGEEQGCKVSEYFSHEGLEELLQ